MVDGVKSTTSAMFGEAKDVFLATLPIGTGILTYWSRPIEVPPRAEMMLARPLP